MSRKISLNCYYLHDFVQHIPLTILTRNPSCLSTIGYAAGSKRGPKGPTRFVN